MRKFQIVGLAVFAVLAFGVLSVASATAAPKLLLNGLNTTELKTAEITGELLLEDQGQKVDILCSGIFDIDVAAGGELFEITEVLMLNKELLAETVTALGASVTGDMVECELMEGPCIGSGAEAILVTAINLPWNVDVLLIESGGNLYRGDILPNAGGDGAGYVVDCETILGLVTDECEIEGETGTVLANEGAGLLAEFSELAEITKHGNCSLGGKEKAVTVGDGLFSAGWTVSE